MNGTRDEKDQVMDMARSGARGSSEGCSCAEAREHLDAFLDHEAGQELTERLARHVAACSHCSRLADAEQHLRDILRSRCVEQAPPELRARVISSLTVMRTTASVTTVRSVRSVRIDRG